jgi:hypothetical protein
MHGLQSLVSSAVVLPSVGIPDPFASEYATDKVRAGSNKFRFVIWNESGPFRTSGLFTLTVDGKTIYQKGIDKQDSTEGTKFDDTFSLKLEAPIPTGAPSYVTRENGIQESTSLNKKTPEPSRAFWFDYFSYPESGFHQWLQTSSQPWEEYSRAAQSPNNVGVLPRVAVKCELLPSQQLKARRRCHELPKKSSTSEKCYTAPRPVTCLQDRWPEMR